MYNISKIISENLWKYRELNGMAREQLAEAVEIDTAYLGQCERGERKLGLKKLIDIILYFNLSPNEIITINVNTNSKNKDKLLEEISVELENCTDSQLMAIKNTLKYIIPYLQA